MEFRFELMAILDVLLVTHGVVRDQRGLFLGSVREEALLKIGIPKVSPGQLAANPEGLRMGYCDDLTR